LAPTNSLWRRPYPEFLGTLTGQPFTFALSGVELAAALNQDGTVNSSTNPAAPGSAISIFATGAGAYSQQVGDGTLGPRQPPFPTPVIGVSALIGPEVPFRGKQAPVLFAGQAPGLVAGVLQMNLLIPDDVPPGSTGIAVFFGNYPSPAPSIFVGSR
jgi:uncharacterized protein (TIGR03437 family)